MDFLILFIDDSLDLIKATHLRDLMTPFFAICWLVTLLIPLKNIDRRCWVTLLTYMLYMLATGVTLFLAIPNQLKETDFSIAKHFAFVIALCPLIVVRWLMVKREIRNG